MVNVIIKTDVPVETNKNVEELVDEDISQFSTFFSTALKNDPLIPSEKAMIKTYLAWKLGLYKPSNMEK